jgi:predicted Zn-dependent peptidase
VELEKERSVILEEIRMYRDQPQSYVYELLDALIWQGHPLGMNLAGTPDTVKKLSRAGLLSFKDRFYSAENLVLTSAGDITHNRLLEIAKKNLAKLPRSDKNTFIPFKTDFKKAHNLFYKKTEQSHLALGFHSLKRGHPDRHALMLLHIILGANMSSRLFDELREKRGLAYEIGTQVKSLTDTGAFIVHAGVDNKRLLGAI